MENFNTELPEEKLGKYDVAEIALAEDLGNKTSAESAEAQKIRLSAEQIATAMLGHKPATESELAYLRNVEEGLRGMD